MGAKILAAAERESLVGIFGQSAGRRALLGFAPANVLYRLSFADVLDETAGKGYQRRFSDAHSLDFRRYIQRPSSTTIPLTFNLRPSGRDRLWTLSTSRSGMGTLEVFGDNPKVLAQVDCQHRLGHLADLEVPLPFMILLELSEREEMEVFNTINSKAKGLSSSLLDYHDARLAKDVAKERPELFVALRLNEDIRSPWYQQLDLGGSQTTGLKRRASLRTMQKAVRRFIAATGALESHSPDEIFLLVRDFWIAVSSSLPEQWADPRRHFLTKGVGVYALMGLMSDLYRESAQRDVDSVRCSIVAAVADFVPEFDWSNSGPLKGLGGESGAAQALEVIRHSRSGTQTGRRER